METKKPGRPRTSTSKTTTVYLQTADIEYLRQIGGGNVSRGIARLAADARTLAQHNTSAV